MKEYIGYMCTFHVPTKGGEWLIYLVEPTKYYDYKGRTPGHKIEETPITKMAGDIPIIVEDVRTDFVISNFRLGKSEKDSIAIGKKAFDTFIEYYKKEILWPKDKSCVSTDMWKVDKDLNVQHVKSFLYDIKREK